jgi:hypothetical protein
MGWFWLLLVMSPVVVFLAVSRNQSRSSVLRSETVTLDVDEFGAVRVLADGRREEVSWSELTEVEVVTAKAGPHAAYGGVVVLGGDEQRGCLVPLDRIESSGLVGQLQMLPGFDLGRLVTAVEEKPPARVTVWSKPS